MLRVVLDTSIVVAGLRANWGLQTASCGSWEQRIGLLAAASVPRV
jgi:hypothetical protein